MTDDIDVPKNREEDEMNSEIPITYVPARNTIFLSYALALAEVEDTFHIFILYDVPCPGESFILGWT